MQAIRVSTGAMAPTGLDPFKVLLASSDGSGTDTAERLQSLGAELQVSDQLYDAIALIFDDPRTTQMLVVDCDDFGGLAAVRRVIGFLMHAEICVPTLLVSSEPEDMPAPTDRRAPVVLRGPVSSRMLSLAVDRLLNGRSGELYADLMAELVDLATFEG